MNYARELSSARKMRSRGFVPVAYKMHDQTAYGCVVKRGRKWITFYSASTGKKRVHMSEEDYMTPITK